MKVYKAKDVAVSSVNMLLYGPPGCGKTTFAATAPGVVIIDYELKAEKSLALHPDIPLLKPNRDDTLPDIVDYCIREKYGTICIDTIDRLFDILMVQMLRKLNRSRPEIQHWGMIMDVIKYEVLKLQAARCHVLLLCHETEERDTDPTAGSQVMNVRPNIPTKLRVQVPAIMDIVGYMGKPRMFDGMRGIWVKPDPKPRWYCKTAWDQLDQAIPPHFGKMLAKILPAATNAAVGSLPAPGTGERIEKPGPAAPTVVKLSELLAPFHAQVCGEAAFLEFDDDARAMLEARYGVCHTSEMPEEQYNTLVAALQNPDHPRSKAILDSIANIWRNRQAQRGQ
jgi:phage nucleotide-binding protein